MTKKTLLVLALLIITGCARVGSGPRYPTAMTPDIQRSWNEAEVLYQSKRLDEADVAYKKFIDSLGYNEYTDDARFKRGEISFSKKKYVEALSYYQEAYANIYNPKISPRSQFKAAYSLYKLDRFAEAKDELKKIIRRDASAVLRVRADSLAVFASRSLKLEPSVAVESYLFLLDDYLDLGLGAKSLQGVTDIIPEADALSFVHRWIDDDKITSEQVAWLPLKEYRGKKSGGYAQYKYGKALYQEGLFSRANKELRSYVSAYPKHEYFGAAKVLLNEATGRSGEAAIKVGLILPLSGKYAIYGESVLHGIECAAGVFAPCDSNGVNVSLVVYDSEGQISRTTDAVDELVAKDVVAIIGPLLSATVQATAERANQLQIPMISLSQKDGVSEIGEYIFRNTVSAESQVLSVVDYAVQRQKLKRYLVLYPESEQGREYKTLFTEAVRNAGGKVVDARGYSSKRSDIASEIKSMSFVSGGQNSFDAVFIPDSFGVAGYIANALGEMGMEGVSFLGISRWDDSRLVSIGGKYIEGAVFPEAFYKKSVNPKVSSFVTSFTQAYGIEPTLLEALGYDSMKMISESVKNGVTQRATLKDKLAQISNFEGVCGRINFNSKRDAIRELPLLTVSNGEIKPLQK